MQSCTDTLVERKIDLTVMQIAAKLLPVLN